MEINFRNLSPADLARIQQSTEDEFVRRWTELQAVIKGQSLQDPPLVRTTPLDELPNSPQQIIRTATLNPDGITQVTTAFKPTRKSQPRFQLSWTGDDFVRGISIVVGKWGKDSEQLDYLSIYSLRFLNNADAELDPLSKFGTNIIPPKYLENLRGAAEQERTRPYCSQLQVLTELTEYLLEVSPTT